MMSTIQRDLADFIRIQVKAGFNNRETIIEDACELFATEDDASKQRRRVTRLVDDLLAQHFVEQRIWSGETDCDRLDEAFAALDRSGIVARQNFTCCQTCGHSEIGGEIDDALEYREVRGYVFYHRQDTERVVESDVLYLAYGSIDGKEEASVEIGYQVVEALEAAELTVIWDGTINKRICILDIIWQRRRLPETLLTLSFD